MIELNENFDWERFLQPYELAIEGFILKIEGIKTQFRLANQYCPIEIVSGRVKSPASILDKAIRLGVDLNRIDEKLYDIGGVRITCKYLEDVYKVGELLKNRSDIEILEIRDYIKNPKKSGYRSLHYICRYYVETIEGTIPVSLEFQIRTHAMHFWASIEHSLKYKFQKQIPEELKERLISASLAAKALDDEMTSIHDTICEIDKVNGEKYFNTSDPYESEVTIKHKKW